MDTPHRDPSDESPGQPGSGQAWSMEPEGSAPVPGTPHFPDAAQPKYEQADGGLPGFGGAGPEGFVDTVRDIDMNPSPMNMHDRGPEYGVPSAYDPSQQQYAQAVPPAGRKGGFNWIACCGIGCGVVLVIGIVAGVVIWKTTGSLVKDTMSIVKVTTEVEGADLAQVVATATPVTAEQLTLAPDSYRDQWLAFEGMVTTEPDPSHEIPQSGSMNGTAYFVEPNIIVMDISQTASVATGGDLIQCIGKLAIMDFSKIGGVGDNIEEEMKKSGELGGQSKMIFVITKGIEVVAEGEGMTDLPEGVEGEADTGDGTDDGAEGSDPSDAGEAAGDEASSGSEDGWS